MKFKNLCLSTTLLLGAPFLVNCSNSKPDVTSYLIEADTTNMKTTYMVGENINPAGLKANLVTLVNGKEKSKDALFTFRLSIDVNKPLTLSDTVLFVLPPESFKGQCLPGTINLTINTPYFNLGENIDLNKQYPGYTFESDKPFIGNVDDDGILHTYREGVFSLVGEHVTEAPVFLNCEVKENEDIKYPNYFYKGSSAGNFILELSISPYIPTNDEFLIEPSYQGTQLIDFKYEFTNPELFTVRLNSHGRQILQTTEKTGSSRIRIYLDDDRFEADKGKMLYDLYAVVTDPFDCYEIQDMLKETQWISYAASGEQYAINFMSNKLGSLSGTQNGAPIEPIDFSFSTKGDIIKGNDRSFAEFHCEGSSGSTSLGVMRVDVNFGKLMLYNSHDNLISIFNIIDEGLTD